MIKCLVFILVQLMFLGATPDLRALAPNKRTYHELPLQSSSRRLSQLPMSFSSAKTLMPGNSKQKNQTANRFLQVDSFAKINVLRTVFLSSLTFSAYWLLTSFPLLGALALLSVFLALAVRKAFSQSQNLLYGLMIFSAVLGMSTWALGITFVPFVALILLSVSVVLVLDDLKISYLKGSLQEVQNDPHYEHIKKEQIYEAMTLPSSALVYSSQGIFAALFVASILLSVLHVPWLSLAFVLIPIVLHIDKQRAWTEPLKMSGFFVGLAVLTLATSLFFAPVMVVPLALSLGFLGVWIVLRNEQRKSMISDDVKSTSDRFLDEFLDIKHRLPTASQRRMELFTLETQRLILNSLLLSALVWSVFINPFFAAIFTLSGLALVFLIPNTQKLPFKALTALSVASVIILALLGQTLWLTIALAMAAIFSLFWINLEDRDSLLEIRSISARQDGILNSFFRGSQRDFSKEQAQVHPESRLLFTAEEVSRALFLSGLIWAVHLAPWFSGFVLVFLLIPLLFKSPWKGLEPLYALSIFAFGTLGLVIFSWFNFYALSFVSIFLIGFGLTMLIHLRQHGGVIWESQSKLDHDLDNRLSAQILKDGQRKSTYSSGLSMALAVLLPIVYAVAIYWTLSFSAGAALLLVLPLVLLVKPAVVSFSGSWWSIGFAALSLGVTALGFVFSWMVLFFSGLSLFAIAMMFYVQSLLRDGQEKPLKRPINTIDSQIVLSDHSAKSSKDIQFPNHPAWPIIPQAERLSVYHGLWKKIPGLHNQNVTRYVLKDSQTEELLTRRSQFKLDRVIGPQDLIGDPNFRAALDYMNHQDVSEKSMQKFLEHWLKQMAQVQHYLEGNPYGFFSAVKLIQNAKGRWTLRSEPQIEQIREKIQGRTVLKQNKATQPLKVSLVQFHPYTGQPMLNALRMVRDMHKAKQRGAQIVLFSELALSGFNNRDLYYSTQFIAEVEHAWKYVRQAADKLQVGVMLGMPTRNGQTMGKNRFNSVHVYVPNQVQGLQSLEYRQHKMLLPTYSEQNEYNYHEPGKPEDIRLINFTGVNDLGESVGINICEDGWNNVLAEQRKYVFDPWEHVIQRGADLVMNFSASPVYLGKTKGLMNEFASVAQFYETPLVYLDIVGNEAGVLFGGYSFIANSEGQVLKTLKYFEQDHFDFDLQHIDQMPVSENNPNYFQRAKMPKGSAQRRENRLEELDLLLKKMILGFAQKNAILPFADLDVPDEVFKLYQDGQALKNYINNIQKNRRANAQKSFLLEFKGDANSLMLAKILGEVLADQSLVELIYKPNFDIPENLQAKQKQYLKQLGFRLTDNIYQNYELQAFSQSKRGAVSLATYNLSDYLLGSVQESLQMYPLLSGISERTVHKYLKHYGLSHLYLAPNAQEDLAIAAKDHIIKQVIKHHHRDYQGIVEDSYEKVMNVFEQLIATQENGPYSKLLQDKPSREKLYLDLIKRLIREVESTETIRSNRLGTPMVTQYSAARFLRPPLELTVQDTDKLIDQAWLQYQSQKFA